jgi:hypothetical protein
VADAARLHLDAHLPWLRIGYLPLDELEIGVGLGYLNDLHSRHGDFLTGVSLLLDANAGGLPMI